MIQFCDRLEREKLLNKQLETIIDTSFDEIFVTDGDGVVLRINPAGEALYGVRGPEIIGKTVASLGKEGFFFTCHLSNCDQEERTGFNDPADKDRQGHSRHRQSGDHSRR